jgi:hypothetical protein
MDGRRRRSLLGATLLPKALDPPGIDAGYRRHRGSSFDDWHVSGYPDNVA